MPHIRVIFPEREKDVVQLLKNSAVKLNIRRALSDIFPKYPVEHIAIIPELLSDRALEFADNLLPLEMVIDIGNHFQQLDENYSDALTEKMIELCPELDEINFGVWLKESTSNGFTEHKPKK